MKKETKSPNSDVALTVLRDGYQRLMDYAETHNIPLSITFENFQSEYQAGTYRDIDQYLDTYYNLLKPEDVKDQTLEFVDVPKWYYNTGTSLPQMPHYSKYDLLYRLKVGDILFEANGGHGITAHIAIVEGKFYDYHLNTRYVRIVEAISDGVVRSVVDDQRFDDRAVTILRTAEPFAIRRQAVDFCVSQIGKKYLLDFAKETSRDEPDWYCSELVWAAYYNLGLDLETDSLLNEPGVTPRDIKNCDKLIEIAPL